MQITIVKQPFSLQTDWIIFVSFGQKFFGISIYLIELDWAEPGTDTLLKSVDKMCPSHSSWIIDHFAMDLDS